MNFLLDTCTFLWQTGDPTKLSKQASEIISDASNFIFLSTVSAWEISAKYGSGKLTLLTPPDVFVSDHYTQQDLIWLPFYPPPALHGYKLPSIHKDPFDRMLICQAIIHNLTIITPDPEIRSYPIQTIW